MSHRVYPLNSVIAALCVAIGVAPQSAFAQYGQSPPAKPKPPTAAEPPPPIEAKPPAAPQSKPAASQPTKSVGQRIEVQPADIKWLERLPKEDRAALDELLGWAPPKFASDLQWVGGEALTWDSLRGKVVVIQSFTTANPVGRKWPERVAEALKQYEAKDLRIIALHTPENADDAKDLLAKKPAPPGVVVAIDPKGNYCDALAIYKHPINVLIDRNGTVRYAGLNENGLEQAAKALVAEPFDQKTIAAQRTDDLAETASTPAADWPAYTNKVTTALDIRGKRAPEFYVADWRNTKAPDASGKVVVIDFWATWCGPCVASIPHMNDLATKYRDDVVCVGISDESPGKFDDGLAKLKDKGITLKSFQYAIALDGSRRMYNAIEVKGIPTCVVMDRNWIVRWEGHPIELDAATLEQIIRADKAAAGGGAGEKPKSPGSSKRKRWTTG